MKLTATIVVILACSSASAQSTEQWPRHAEAFQQICRRQFDNVTCHCTLHRLVRRVGYDMLGKQLASFGDELFVNSCIAELTASVVRGCSAHKASTLRRAGTNAAARADP